MKHGDDMIKEHCETLTELKLKYDIVSKDIKGIAKSLADMHKVLCQSNGKQSVIDSLHETKKRVDNLENILIENKKETKWAIDKILMTLGILGNIILTWLLR